MSSKTKKVKSSSDYQAEIDELLSKMEDVKRLKEQAEAAEAERDAEARRSYAENLGDALLQVFKLDWKRLDSLALLTEVHDNIDRYDMGSENTMAEQAASVSGRKISAFLKDLDKKDKDEAQGRATPQVEAASTSEPPIEGGRPAFSPQLPV